MRRQWRVIVLGMSARRYPALMGAGSALARERMSMTFE
jgi:hypothetical protein